MEGHIETTPTSSASRSTPHYEPVIRKLHAAQYHLQQSEADMQLRLEQRRNLDRPRFWHNNTHAEDSPIVVI